MTQISSIHSYRGGTGKSNLTANLATTIALSGKRVGIVDTDIQSPGIHILFRLDETKITRCATSKNRGMPPSSLTIKSILNLVSGHENNLLLW